MKKIIIITVSCVLICGLIIAGAIMFFNRNNNDNNTSTVSSKLKSIESFEKINNGVSSDILFYVYRYSGGEEERSLEKSAVCDTESIINILNECKVYKWNGFHGKHPKNVLDGKMFDFSASVNNGINIRADGSANFPDNYNEFISWLGEQLNK